MNSTLRCRALGAALTGLIAMTTAPALAQTAAPGIALPADLTPNTPQPPQVARQKRIDEWLARKQYAQALAELDKDVAAQPRNAQARFQRAVALAGLGRSDDAVVAFSQMTQDFPELPEPYLNLPRSTPSAASCCAPARP